MQKSSRADVLSRCRTRYRSVDPSRKSKTPTTNSPQLPDCCPEVEYPAESWLVKMAVTYRREYVAWLKATKHLETREKRLAETLAALEADLKWVDRKKATK